MSCCSDTQRSNTGCWTLVLYSELWWQYLWKSLDMLLRRFVTFALLLTPQPPSPQLQFYDKHEYAHCLLSASHVGHMTYPVLLFTGRKHVLSAEPLTYSWKKPYTANMSLAPNLWHTVGKNLILQTCPLRRTSDLQLEKTLYSECVG